MEPEIREEIRRGTYDRQSFARVQKLLPTNDQELNGLIDELLAENAGKDFVFTVACAVGANRPVHAKCLLKGIRALVEENWLTIVVHKLEGDVGQYLLQCVAAESFEVAEEAYILYAIVLWAKKSGGRYATPPQVLHRCRALIRNDLRLGYIDTRFNVCRISPDPTQSFRRK